MATCYTGIITGSGTQLPGGVTVSGSNYVYYTYEIPCPSGSLLLRSETSAYGSGLSPLDEQKGLLAWYNFDQAGPTLLDVSGNSYHATVHGNLDVITGHNYLGRKVGPEPHGYVAAPVPTQSGAVMFSFWMNPSLTLTSGHSNSFTLLSSRPFNGDHFVDPWDYAGTGQYKGWYSGYIGNAFVRCESGYNNTFLRIQGAPNTDWVVADYSSSTMYFPIDVNLNWDIEVSFQVGSFSNGQSFSLIFTNEYNLGDNCIVSLEYDGMSGYVRTKSGDLEYDDISGLVFPPVGLGTYGLRVKKRGDLIRFYFKDYTVNTYYELSHSFEEDWEGPMLIGLQSSNSTGIAPEVLVDYVSFNKGLKPATLGDTTASGRFVVSYNEVDIGVETGERTDGRFWVYSDHSGGAYGTSTFKWNTDQWYLLQVGFNPQAAPGEEYCWWVDGQQERGFYIEGNIVSSQIITSGIEFFDPLPSTPSGMVALDDVSVWERWLGTEEILKIINRVSQVAWFYGTPYIPANHNVIAFDTTESGSISLAMFDPALPRFDCSMYTREDLPTKQVQIEKISYRIEKQTSLRATELDGVLASIVRCSSGWIAKNLGCYSCPDALACTCDVRGLISVYTRDFDYPGTSALVTSTRRRFEYDVPFVFIGLDSVVAGYYVPQFDTRSPQLSLLHPGRNERMVDSSFGEYSPQAARWEVTETVSDLDPSTNRVWIKRNSNNKHSYIVEDNFCFYDYDFLTTSGDSNGWSVLNTHSGVSKLHINEGFSARVTLPSGIDYKAAYSDFGDVVDTLARTSNHYSPTCVVDGSRLLETAVVDGAWNTDEQSAPFVYWTVASGHTDWQIVTRVEIDRVGPGEGKWAGLMATDASDNSKFIQVLVDQGGVVARSSLAGDDLGNVPVVSTGLRATAPVWLKLRRNDELESKYAAYWSADGESWEKVEIYSGSENRLPAMSANNDPPYQISASSEQAVGYEAYRVTQVSDSWVSGDTMPQWIKWYAGGRYEKIGKYRFKPVLQYRADWRGYPHYFFLQGSNDNDLWVNVDERSVLDPRSDAYSPFYFTQASGWYRYYRFYFMSGYDVIPTDYVGLGQIELYGVTPLDTTFDGVDLNIGVVTLMHKDWATSPQYSSSNQFPEFTDENPVGDWGIYTEWESGDNKAWKTRSSDLDNEFYISCAWSVDHYPRYISYYNAVTPFEIYAYRFRNPELTGDDVGLVDFCLQGSGVCVGDWFTLDERLDQPALGEYDWSEWFIINAENRAAYKNHRLLFHSNEPLDESARFVEWQFRMRTSDPTSYTTSGITYADYQYFKFESDSSVTSLSGLGDPWELLLEGTTGLTSSGSSGVPSYTEISSKQGRLLYVTSTPFNKNEDVFVRFQTADEGAVAVDYDIDSNTMLYLTANHVSGLSVTSDIGSTVSGQDEDYIFDKSGNNTPITSYGVTTASGPAFQGQSSFGFSGYSYIYPDFGDFDFEAEDWTFHAWVNRDSTLDAVVFSVMDGSFMKFSLGMEEGKVTVYGPDYSVLSEMDVAWDDDWSHVVLLKNDGWLIQYGEGYRCPDVIDFPTYEPVSYYRSGVSANKWMDETALPSNLFDGDRFSYYASGSIPWEDPVILSVSFNCTHLGLLGFRFRPSRNSSYWYEDTPKDIYLWGSNAKNPDLNSDRDWYYIEHLTNLPSGHRFSWGPWNYTTPGNEFMHFRFVIPSNYSPEMSNWIVMTEMEISYYESYRPGNLYFLIGPYLRGNMDQIVFSAEALWHGDIRYSNYLDEVFTFKVIDWTDIQTELDVIADIHAPVVHAVSPIEGETSFCPASGIVFDVLDDSTGVDWTAVVIEIEGITVFSGGNNLTDFYPDKGILTWEDRGQQNGEWVSHLSHPSSGVEWVDGINRQLYPPGTVYSGSGAWGRRFTYHVPDSTQIDYFGREINIHVEGQDLYGSLSQFDSISPNTFSYDYSFTTISNSNIRFGGFWLDPGESERLDILTAQGRHFYVDLADYNYPATDIVESNCWLTCYDGTHEATCSGLWFTTWTGNGYTGPLGQVFHRLHYNPENEYNLQGHRTMVFTVHAENDDPLCAVYNRESYDLLYGWEIYWNHTDDPFEFDHKFPVFVGAKTDRYVPSRFGKSYMLWASPGRTYDLPVYLNIPPESHEDFSIGVLAQSKYLQYSEDVVVEVECQDMDGNQLYYSWAFKTEDKPDD